MKQKGFWSKLWSWFWGQTPEPVIDITPPEFDINEMLLTLLLLHNDVRDKHNVAQLMMRERLNMVAQQHAETMARLRSTEHDAGGVSFMDRVLAADYPLSSGGENIAVGPHSPVEVVKAWMCRPGHRKNILNAYWWHVGFGVASDGNRLYWCTVFAIPSRRDAGSSAILILPDAVESH